jgi:hypothetical protein
LNWQPGTGKHGRNTAGTSKVLWSRKNDTAKVKRRQEVFSEDCRKAFEMGMIKKDEPEIIPFGSPKAWNQWLKANHDLPKEFG